MLVIVFITSIALFIT